MYWGLENQSKEDCGKCGMKKDAANKGCCKDEHKQLKLEDSKKAADFIIDPVILITPSPVESSYTYSIPDYADLTLEFPVSHAPPRLHANPVYLLNCTFRI